jgi:uncharacterized membrane protein
MEENKTKNTSTLQRVASVIGGFMLIGNGLRKGSIFKTAVGSYLAYRGIAGHRTFDELRDSIQKISSGRAINIRTHMVINRPRHEVYARWRNLSNLPLFMQHLVSVQEISPVDSTWELQLPAGLGSLRWNAEIVKEREFELLGWRSVEGSDIQNAGKVEFRDALGQEGTAVDIVLSYHVPLGKPGEKVARLFSPLFKKMILDDIRNFKNFVENMPAEEGIHIVALS